MGLTNRDRILISTFAALTAVGAFIRIPIPYVPFTMQVFFCGMSAVILGGKKAMLSQILYVLLGLIGCPIFTNGGGPQYIFQPTFGYLIGFIIASYAIGSYISIKKVINFRNLFVGNLLGLAIIYFIGVIYLYLINNLYLGTTMAISTAIYYGFLTTIGGDIISIFLVSTIGVKVLAVVKN